MRYNALTNGIMLEHALSDAHQAHTEAPVELLVPTLAPTGDATLWVPIGPSTVLHGQAGSRPRVAGRVRDIAVSPDGQRAYAATANGGVWFTSDAGNTWSPLGNWLPTPGAAGIDRAATGLACGCLLVGFGAAADGSADDVYVGTGELAPRTQGTPGGELGGVGVLHLDHPVPAVLADPFGIHWKREATNLAGCGIYRLARDPHNANTLVAATSIGLFTRTGAFVENADWARVTVDPFNFTAADFKQTTDVLWVNPAAASLWVTLEAGPDTGVWTSTNGVAGPFQKVVLPNILQDRRLGLAVAPSDHTVIYVLGGGPRLWRINGIIPTQVAGLPNALFGSGTQDQSWYDLAIAVHPDNKDVIAMGGSTTFADGQWSASLFKCTLTASGGGLTAGFLAANQNNPGNDPTFIGTGVHADVHQIRFVKVGADIHVWVGCDGGVFRSPNSGNQYTFVARNAGLAVLEAGYVVSHPDNDTFVLAGAQDNGLLMRVGDTVWMHSDDIGGDAGGAVIHPIKTGYFAAQYTQADWYSNGQLSHPVRRGTGGASEGDENNHASFYSGGDIRKIGAAQARFAIGTNRVWLADNWDPEVATTSWVTLPSGNDPRAGSGTDVATDTYGEGTGTIVACKWAADDRLLVLIQSRRPEGKDSAVLMYKRRADGTWERTAISEHSNKKSDYSNGDISQPTSSYLPPLGAWSDLAIHDSARGTHGSCYVATTGYVKVDGNNLIEADRMDTLWWYDGSGTWYPTTLRSANSPGNTGTKAPAYAVACDPTDPTKVYVGTALGVWRGVLTLGGPTPSWQWQIFSNGLPEAAVQDIAFYQKGTRKILRAAIQSRGVWEVDLSATPSPTQRTFLRVHANDARRADITSLTNPMKFGPTDWPWHASPDVRIRPAPLEGAEPIPTPPAAGGNSLPWSGGAPDQYLLWIFQTAMHKIDPLCRPDGQWNNQFDARLRAQDAALGTTITIARWNTIVTQPNVFSPPWDGLEPTEADLYELIVEDPPDPINTPAPGPPLISNVRRRKYKVDVLVHYRDVRPLAATNVRLTLLRRLIPADATQWPAIAIGAPWKTAVEQLMSDTTPPGWSLPDGWTVADSGSRTRQPSSDVDARTPRAVTFDIDFSAATAGQHFVLLAIVHSTPDPVSAASLGGANLRDLVLNCHQVAARVAKIR
jgi:hypothetical protein